MGLPGRDPLRPAGSSEPTRGQELAVKRCDEGVRIMAQRTVDCHNHWYPPDYLEYLVGRTEFPYARQTGPTSYLCYAPGGVIVAHIDRAGHYDLKARIEALVKGLQAFSNVNGKPLFVDEFDPIWALANELDLPFLVHPTVPLTASVMDMVRIPYQLYGYTLDTSMAVISLIFNGVFQKYPNLKAVHSHLGGMVPYLVQRLKASWKGYAAEWGLELEETPDITYADRVWPDTTSFYLPAMRCALEWVGPGHLVVGTDYAHPVGDPEGP